MEEKECEERRRYVRLDVETKVNFQIKKERQQEVPSERVSAITKDMSTEGICFTSQTQLEPGSKLELEIFLPSQSIPLHVKGKVKWSKPVQSKGEDRIVFDTGVKLLTIEKSDENRFIKYVCDKMVERCF